MKYSVKDLSDLKREPRKRGKSIFIYKKSGINEDKVAKLISCDKKWNKHL